MCLWVVLGEVVIGTLEATDRPQAERLAVARFGQALARVQSQASWAVAEEERLAAQERRRLIFEAGGSEGGGDPW